MKRKIIIILTLILVDRIIIAQDLHWSLINDNKIQQNAANTGGFNGDYRFSIANRNQWKSVTVPYKSNALSFEISSVYLTNFSIGTILTYDVTGDGKYKSTQGILSAKYPIIINKIKRLNIGLQVGFANQNLNLNAFKFDNQFNGYTFDNLLPNKENNLNYSFNYLVLNTGVNYREKISNNQNYTFGISINNLNRPKNSYYNQKVNLKIRTLLNAELNTLYNDKIELCNYLILANQGANNEFLFGSKVNMNVTNSKNVSVGLNIRYKDAIIPFVFYKYNNLNVGLSYDINTSTLTKASQGRGSIEILLVYIFNKKNNFIIKQEKCIDYL